MACPCEGEVNFVSRLVPKPGIFLVIVLAKTLANWLMEISKFVDCTDRKVMQLRVFYAHGGTTFKGVNAEPLTDVNAELLRCDDRGNARPGQERFLVLTTPESYRTQVRDKINGKGRTAEAKSERTIVHDYQLGQIHVDEFHNTKSDTAPTPTLVTDYKNEWSNALETEHPQKDGESHKKYHRRMKELYQINLPYVCGYSATPWSKSFKDLAAMVKSIEQPWWKSKYEPTMSQMTGEACREIGRKTENMEHRLNEPQQHELDENINEMQLVLDKLVIKRTATSKTIDNTQVLVKLPPHETRKITCPTNDR